MLILGGDILGYIDGKGLGLCIREFGSGFGDVEVIIELHSPHGVL